MTDFTTIGPQSGAIRWRRPYRAISMTAGPDDPWPIGRAMPDSRDDDGCTLWRLTIHRRELPGLWRVIDRLFRPVKRNGRGSSG
jgi:hypothetical protein